MQKPAIRTVGGPQEDTSTLLLFNDETIRPELPNRDVDSVAAFHRTGWVRECHPIRHTRFGRAALTQFPDFFHLRNNQLDSGLLVDQLRLGLLIIEGCGSVRI